MNDYENNASAVGAASADRNRLARRFEIGEGIQQKALDKNQKEV
jgi:hypothetical protein